MRHIPNILSSIRLLLVGVFAYLFSKAHYLACLAVFTAAFLTDLLDGYLARRNNWISDVGKVLDPLADKFMVLTALTCFYLRGWLPLWILIVVLAKELIMIVGGIILFKKEVVVYADWFGKSAAGFFNMGVALILAKVFLPWLGSAGIIVLGIAMVLAIVALLHYAKRQVFSRQGQNAGSEGQA
jgi:CDP-diacylglycerol--glycerol-3-phosphate 3-phosphatidyltransferase